MSSWEKKDPGVSLEEDTACAKTRRGKYGTFLGGCGADVDKWSAREGDKGQDQRSKQGQITLDHGLVRVAGSSAEGSRELWEPSGKA